MSQNWKAGSGLNTVPTCGAAPQAQAFKTRTGLCRHSNPSLFASGNSAGKEFGEARDGVATFGGDRRFRAAETALSGVSGGKAAESQRLFRRRQETGIAWDCVVELAGLELANKRLCMAMEEALRDAASKREAQHLMLA
jgi:hypothetical protein